MARTRIKICGIRTPEDARAAAHAGADAIGLLFWQQSRRSVSPESVEEVAAALPPFVSRVAVLVDPPAAFVEDLLGRVRVDVLQFHGEESPQTCASFGLPYIKALRVKPELDLLAAAERYAGAQGLLLDAYHAAVPGGSGETFDWGLIPGDLDLPVVLAGGLHAGNVADAIRRVRPWAVDVSGGVEASRGVKDAARMAAFVSEVRRVEVA